MPAVGAHDKGGNVAVETEGQEAGEDGCGEEAEEEGGEACPENPNSLLVLAAHGADHGSELTALIVGRHGGAVEPVRRVLQQRGAGGREALGVLLRGERERRMGLDGGEAPGDPLQLLGDGAEGGAVVRGGGGLAGEGGADRLHRLAQGRHLVAQVLKGSLGSIGTVGLKIVVHGSAPQAEAKALAAAQAQLVRQLAAELLGVDHALEPGALGEAEFLAALAENLVERMVLLDFLGHLTLPPGMPPPEAGVRHEEDGRCARAGSARSRSSAS